MSDTPDLEKLEALVKVNLPQLREHMSECATKDALGYPGVLVPEFSRGFYSVLLDGLEAVPALIAQLKRLEAALQEKLPCDVKLLPATKIKKGCTVETLLAGLKSRSIMKGPL